MSPQHEIEAFIKTYVRDLEEDSAAIFAGAGMSKSSGYVDWRELMHDIIAELGLDVKAERDFISVAQFHVNTKKTIDGLARKILQEFSENAQPSVTHEILARLPLRTYWTTNYDTLIEDALRNAYRVPDVKYDIDQLTTTRPKRDAVVYKMHGDVHVPKRAILYKEQYEKYHLDHAPFITALSGDLVSKTFLFIGFSFTDPNLDYVLSRLHGGTGKRTHYCFMKDISEKDFSDDQLLRYEQRKLELRIEDLKRFGIQTLLVDDYSDIPRILLEIEKRYRKKTIFFSGSAEEYGTWSRQEALDFVHALSAESVKANLRVVNGFGWGVGSAVINGALEAIYGNPQRYTENQLIVRPFPQHGANLPTLWEEYRQRMIGLAGVAVFVFGNKATDGRVVNAGGVRREFQIAIEHGLVPIPIAATGYMAQEIWEEVLRAPEKFYPGMPWIIPLIQDLAHRDSSGATLVTRVTTIIQKLTK
jgi:hypothetical protein